MRDYLYGDYLTKKSFSKEQKVPTNESINKISKCLHFHCICGTGLVQFSFNTKPFRVHTSQLNFSQSSDLIFMKQIMKAKKVHTI